MPLTLPLRYSSVQSNAVTNSSCRWTRVLRVPTLPMLSCVLWPEDMRNFVQQYPRRRWELKQCCRSPNLDESCLSESSVARLIYAIFIVNKTSSSITVPLTKQGPCSDSKRSGPTPKAVPKTPRLLVGQCAREIGRKLRRGRYASAGRC